MNLITRLKKKYILPLVALLCVVAVTSCNDENELGGNGVGYVQFKLYKKTISETTAASRAGVDRLDSLYEAKKMIVTIQNAEGEQITQSVSLNAYNSTNAEFGMRSDNLELMAGTYTLIGYRLFNKLERQILAGSPEEIVPFTVVEGGLSMQDVYVNAINSGLVRFKVVKDLSVSTANTASRAGSETFLFSDIAFIDVTVEDSYSHQQTSFKNIRVNCKTLYDGEKAGSMQIEEGVVDTLVSLPAGNYSVVKYTPKDKLKKNLLAANIPVVKESVFTVVNNEVCEDVEIPVTMTGIDENIKDYIALKRIWESLDGKNWSYRGENYPRGTNWNFNKQIDMWGKQPGVAINSAGRVTALHLGEFNPKGVVPAELGQLTELTVLTFGSHNDMVGNQTPDYAISSNKKYGGISPRILPGTTREEWEEYYSKNENEIMPVDVTSGIYTNGITALSDGIDWSKLVNLEQLYIANSPITKLPAAMKGQLQNLRDFEIYNCPNLGSPEGIASLKDIVPQFANIEGVNLAMNKSWGGDVVLDLLKAISAQDAPSAKAIQILYLSNNELTELPDEFVNLVKLGKLDCAYNKISKIPALSNSSLVDVTFDYNELTAIPENFCKLGDVEKFSFAHNKLTELPNIFDATSPYVMGTLDFSYNQIASIEGVNPDGTASDDYHGINAGIINLSYNKLEYYPVAIFQKESPVTSLSLTGNLITSIPKGAMDYKNAKMLQALDLSFNKIKDIPQDFMYYTPYLTGLELSYNQLDRFPYTVLNAPSLQGLGVSNQRDEFGNRCMTEWPEGIKNHKALGRLFLASNGIGKVPETETLSSRIYIVDISDNPDIVINVSSVCAYIAAGAYMLIYDPTQDIRGCSALKLDR